MCTEEWYQYIHNGKNWVQAHPHETLPKDQFGYWSDIHKRWFTGNGSPMDFTKPSPFAFHVSEKASPAEIITLRSHAGLDETQLYAHVQPYIMIEDRGFPTGKPLPLTWIN